MTILFFSCIDHKGNHQECSGGWPDIESCFDALTALVQDGWRLKSVGLLDHDKSLIPLPVNAFDEVAMSYHLYSLKQDWEQILI